ncbi:MAG: ferredoxin family protein [Desulfobacteraceae bacterium]|nr:MAG: ferredoxin family protein [Desulfobacteraceae bacterium]
MKGFRYLSDVTTLKLDPTACIGCGACTEVCPHQVFALNDRKARIADLNGCMECGACMLNCPTQAIRLKPGVGCASYIIKAWLNGKKVSFDNKANCC